MDHEFRVTVCPDQVYELDDYQSYCSHDLEERYKRKLQLVLNIPRKHVGPQRSYYPEHKARCPFQYRILETESEIRIR